MDVEKNLEYEYPLALTPTGQNGTFEIVAKKVQTHMSLGEIPMKL